VILGYHGITRSPLRQDLSLLLVRPARFRAQIESLLEAGFRFVTVAELARLGAGGEPPPGYAAISFDDGMRNNRTIALPILRDYGIAATVYVTIGFIDGISPWIGAKSDNRMLSEQEIRELAREGWELGAHTMTHPDLSTLDYAACRREIEESRTALERIGEVGVETFAYPFGHYGPAAVAAVRDSGLLAAVATGLGSWDAYELRRAMIGAADPTPIFLLKLADRYEPLLRLPPVDLLRQASKRLRGRIQESQRHGPPDRGDANRKDMGRKAVGREDADRGDVGVGG
jgi:peptidoglycan/xylan/chitin deacetylase (PgdA/CDA1 family)